MFLASKFKARQVEDLMEVPDWRPKRTHGALASATPKEQQLQSARMERWPPMGSQTVDVTIMSAAGPGQIFV